LPEILPEVFLINIPGIVRPGARIGLFWIGGISMEAGACDTRDSVCAHLVFMDWNINNYSKKNLKNPKKNEKNACQTKSPHI